MQAQRVFEAARPAGLSQGVILSLIAVLPTMGSVLIVPILGRFVAAFGAVPGIAVIAPAIVTLPALCIGLSSSFAGIAADRFGRRRLLIAALFVYALAGMAPAFLTSLPLIVATRIVVGLAEAVIMTCATTLVGDYFSGDERERWLSYQAAFVAIGATVLFVVGGALGEGGWQRPFLAYGLASVLGVCAVLALPDVRGLATRADGAAFPWAPFRRFILLAILVALAFYIVPIQLGFILPSVGISAPQTIGLLLALDSLAIAAGAISFHFVSRLGAGRLIPLAVLAAGGGLVLIVHATAPLAIVAGLALNGTGCGLLLPTLLAMTMERLPFALRGRGTGIYMSAFFIGQFASPIVVAIVSHAAGSLTAAIGWLGWAFLVAGAAGAAKRFTAVRA